MDKRDLKIFTIEKNPYHHQSCGWYENLKKEDIIHLNESDYYLLEKRFNFWESINNELSEDSGYMGGPTMWEDTWINDKEELIRVREIVSSLIERSQSNSKEEMEVLNRIYQLISRALENKYWLVFDL